MDVRHRGMIRNGIDDISARSSSATIVSSSDPSGQVMTIALSPGTLKNGRTALDSTVCPSIDRYSFFTCSFSFAEKREEEPAAVIIAANGGMLIFQVLRRFSS